MKQGQIVLYAILAIIVIFIVYKLVNKEEQYAIINEKHHVWRRGVGARNFTGDKISIDACQEKRPNWTVKQAGCENAMSWQRKVDGCDQFWCQYDDTPKAPLPPQKCWADFVCKGGKKCKGTGTTTFTQNGNTFESIVNGVCV